MVVRDLESLYHCGSWANGKVEGYLWEFLATLKDEDLDRNIEFTIGR